MKIKQKSMLCFNFDVGIILKADLVTKITAKSAKSWPEVLEIHSQSLQIQSSSPISKSLEILSDQCTATPRDPGM